jgi:hypothetical protein
MISAAQNMKGYDMTETTQHEKAEDLIALKQGISRRQADRRLGVARRRKTA